MADVWLILSAALVETEGRIISGGLIVIVAVSSADKASLSTYTLAVYVPSFS